MHLSRAWIALPLTVAALALSACGEDEESEPAGTTEAKAPA